MGGVPGRHREPGGYAPAIAMAPVAAGRRPARAQRAGACAGVALVALLGGCGGSGGGGGTGGTTGVPTVVLPGGTDGGTDGGGTGGDDSGFTEIVRPKAMPDARGLLPSFTFAATAADPDEPDAKVVYNSFESVHFSGSANCSSCHTNEQMTVSTDAGPRDVSIGTAWETSTMANAARDPYWHAVVAYELDKYPMHEEEINDTCTRCHAPMANEYARKEALETPHILDKGSEEDGTYEPGLLTRAAEDTLFQHAADGVSCSLCHQIDATNLGTEEGAVMPESSQTGGYEIVDYSDGDLILRPAYGQYSENLISGYMSQRSSFSPVFGAHMSRSETCATCHNLNVEPLDSEGVPVEGVEHFAEQANYTEWLFSDYRRGGELEASCQDCHMPLLENGAEVVIGEGAQEARPNFREHTFLGANTVMQSMMRDYAEELGIPPDLDFDASIERNRAFLQNESATIAVTNLVQSAESDGERLAFDVEVTNRTGHKLPSGYHSRRVWLNVRVTDANGEQVFESGAMRANGSIVGVAEDINPNAWERHFDEITSATQVQVYQAIVGNSDDVRTQSLLNGSHYLKDNRLTPSGFFKKSVTGSPAVPESFGVFGGAMEDDDFDDGADTVAYRVAVPAAGSYTVSAELRYQPISYGHLNELFRESDRLDEVDRFRTIWEGTTLKAESLASASAGTDD